MKTLGNPSDLRQNLKNGLKRNQTPQIPIMNFKWKSQSCNMKTCNHFLNKWCACMTQKKQQQAHPRDSNCSLRHENKFGVFSSILPFLLIQILFRDPVTECIVFSSQFCCSVSLMCRLKLTVFTPNFTIFCLINTLWYYQTNTHKYQP